MEKPVITIIVPVYNGEAHLDECLQSIQKQSFKDFEVLVIDDGSTDSSFSIAEKFAKSDARFICLSQENAGPGAARNNALAQAKGDYVYCCDADDFLRPQMLEKLLNALKKSGADIALTGFYTYNQQCKKGFYAGWGMTHTQDYPLYPKGGFDAQTNPRYFFETVQNIPWNKLIKKSLLDENNIRFQNLYLTEDLMYSLPACVCAKKIIRLEEPLLYHREFLKTNAMSNKGAHPEDVVLAFAEFKKWLEARDLFEHFKESYQNWLLNGLHYNLPFYTDFEDFKKVYILIKKDNLETIGLNDCKAETIEDPRYQRLLEALNKPTIEECLLGMVNLLALQTQDMDCEFQSLQRNPKWLLSNLKHLKD